MPTPMGIQTSLMVPLHSSSRRGISLHSLVITALNNMSMTATPSVGTSSWIQTPPPTCRPPMVISPLPHPLRSSPLSHIIVGNGSSLPITHTDHSTFSTPPISLQLHNIFVAPHLIKNLISVHSFTRDNYVSVEFDPFGFSIKVPRKKMEIPRCNSQGDLYPLCSNDFAASTQAFQIVTNDLWHQRLGHPSREALTRALQSYDVSCNKATSTCHACQLGKHVRMQFILPRHLLVLLFN